MSAYEQTEGSFDFGWLPSNYHCDVQTFTNSSQTGSANLRWVKPRGVSMVFMMVIGSGGGGGGGFTATSGSARGGGGGGACGAIATMIKPAIFLPDNLTVFVGQGGKGSTGSGVSGGAGAQTFISYGFGLNQANSIPNIVLLTSTSTAGGGGAGTGAAVGSGGSAPAVGTTAMQGHSAAFGPTSFFAGIIGAAGGAIAGGAGVAITAGWNLIPLTPGAGGGGVTTASTGFAGGAVSLQGIMDFADGGFSPAAILPGGLAGSASAAGNGQDGLQCFKPFVMTGGTGGGSSDGSTGGTGGAGGIGCGGGGGGGGATGGGGGNGGDGFAVIISW